MQFLKIFSASVQDFSANSCTSLDRKVRHLNFSIFEMFCAISTQKGDKSVMAISAKAAKDSDRKQSFERLELVPKVAIPQCGSAKFFATITHSRFYVKSILVKLKCQNLQFGQFSFKVSCLKLQKWQFLRNYFLIKS